MSSFYDPETWDWVPAVVDSNSTTYPFSFTASNDPSSPAYDDLYEIYPETYGWIGASDSPVATLDGIPSAVAPLIIAHNTNSSAHSNISLAAARITSGTFNAARIPNLDASKINSGTFDAARIPGLSASKITSGTFNAARIPNLDASKINSGTFGAARIPSLDASKITSGTFDAARIPNLDAAKIASGALDAGRIPSLAMS